LLSVDAQIKVAEEINRDQSVETIRALKKPGSVTEVVKQTNRSSKVCH
jgi:hypothetical protein